MQQNRVKDLHAGLMSEIPLRDTLKNQLYAKYHALQDAALALDPPLPQHFSGRGIVICAGGPRLFACAWVLLHMLREVLGCTLPIEVWYVGAGEMDPIMLALLRTFHCVEPMDATGISSYERIRSQHPHALKPFAILHSSFREVLLIDADNVPIADPSFLFDTTQYTETGALFWPDLKPIPESSAVWELTRVPYRREPAFESGQLVIDKARCWKPLSVAMHLNEYANFYYKYLYGDKETFHFGWHMASRQYTMAASSPDVLMPASDPTRLATGPVLLQKDCSGKVLFQHKNWPKWTAFGENLHFPGFLYETECLQFLARLEKVWDGRVATNELTPPENYKSGASRWYRYLLIGQGQRLLEFLPNHGIGAGTRECERAWRVTDDGQALEILGDNWTTCRLRKDSDGIWKGNWLVNEKFTVELTALP